MCLSFTWIVILVIGAFLNVTQAHNGSVSLSQEATTTNANPDVDSTSRTKRHHHGPEPPNVKQLDHVREHPPVKQSSRGTTEPPTVKQLAHINPETGLEYGLRHGQKYGFSATKIDSSHVAHGHLDGLNTKSWVFLKFWLGTSTEEPFRNASMDFIKEINEGGLFTDPEAKEAELETDANASKPTQSAGTKSIKVPSGTYQASAYRNDDIVPAVAGDSFVETESSTSISPTSSFPPPELNQTESNSSTVESSKNILSRKKRSLHTPETKNKDPEEEQHVSSLFHFLKAMTITRVKPVPGVVEG